MRGQAVVVAARGSTFRVGVAQVGDVLAAVDCVAVTVGVMYERDPADSRVPGEIGDAEGDSRPDPRLRRRSSQISELRLISPVVSLRQSQPPTLACRDSIADRPRGRLIACFTCITAFATSSINGQVQEEMRVKEDESDGPTLETPETAESVGRARCDRLAALRRRSLEHVDSAGIFIPRRGVSGVVSINHPVVERRLPPPRLARRDRRRDRWPGGWRTSRSRSRRSGAPAALARGRPASHSDAVVQLAAEPAVREVDAVAR